MLRTRLPSPSSFRAISARGLSSSSSAPVLITPSKLTSLLASPTPPVVLDASWHMPNLVPPRNAFAEFKTKRIPNAAFWSVDVIATKDEGPVKLQHMLPTPEMFADACSRLGIERSSHVVVYDTAGLFSAPRTAFTFKAFGHPNVSILDGGLPRWIAERNPVDTALPSHPNPHETDFVKAAYGPILSVLLYDKRPGVESYFISDIEDAGMKEYPVPELDPEFVRSYEEVVENSEKSDGAAVVLDARPAARFHSTSPEPRAGLSSGHIPHSLSLPFSSLLSAPSTTTPPYSTLLPPLELEKVFTETLGEEGWKAVKSGEKSVISTCGSGMTAAVTWLALKVAGSEGKVGLFDESWTGYAGREGSKIEKTE